MAKKHGLDNTNTPSHGTPAKKKQRTNVANITDETINLSPEQAVQARMPELEEQRRQTVEKEGRTTEGSVAAYPQHGVYVSTHIRKNQTASVVAGYLNCANVAQLHQRFTEGPAGKALSDLYQEAKKQNGAYGTVWTNHSVDGKPINLNVDTLFSKANEIQHCDLDLAVETSADRFEQGSAMWMYLYWLRTAKKVMQAVPSSFTGPFHKRVSRRYVGGLQAEDIHRFIVLYKMFYCIRMKRGGDHSSFKNEMMQLPVFYIEGMTITPSQSALNHRAILQMSHASPNELLRLIPEANDRVTDVLADRVSDILKDLARGSSRVGEPPRLSEEDRVQVLKTVAASVQYLFRDRAHRNTFFAPVDAVDAMPLQSLSQLGGEGIKAEFEAADDSEICARAAFMAQQRTLSAYSAKAPGWQEVSRYLKLEEDPSNEAASTKVQSAFSFRGLRLLPWHPEAIAWMCKMLASDLHGCLIRDDTGLGKTVAILGVVVAQSEMQEVHKPVLVVVTPTGLGSWCDDARKFFPKTHGDRGITLKAFCHLDGGITDNDLAIHAAKDLERFCQNLDPDNPQTSRTVILTTYQTLVKRARFEGECITSEGHIMSLSEEDADDDASIDSGDQSAASGEDSKQISRDLFSLLVVDEAHNFRHKKSAQSRKLAQLQVQGTILCTATPMPNSVDDLEGLLALLWRSQSAAEPNAAAYVSLYNDLETKYNGDFFQIPEQKVQTWLSTINPDNYRKALRERDPGDDAAVEITRLPLILASIRRTMGSTVQVGEQEVRVGDDIPPYSITFVELRQDDYEAGLYRTNALDIQRCHKAQKNQLVTEPRHMANSFNPLLDVFYRRKYNRGALSKLQASEDAFALFFDCTKGGVVHMLAPMDQTSRVQWLVGSSVKMKALCQELLDIVIQGEEKLLIYAALPINLDNIELLLRALSIEFLTIRAKDDNARRRHAQSRFNDDERLQVLVCSTRSGAESLNLQRGGSNIIIMDVVPISTILQIVGRVFRVGQKKKQIVKILCVDETYDQVLLHRHVGNWTRQVDAIGAVEVGNCPPRGADTNDALRNAHVRSFVRSALGLRSDCQADAWAESSVSKNLLPEQTLFRLASGGQMAWETLELLYKQESAETPEVISPVDGLSLRPHITRPFEDADIVHETIRAARQLAQEPEYQLAGVSAISCLTAAAESWRYNTSAEFPALTEALGRMSLDAQSAVPSLKSSVDQRAAAKEDENIAAAIYVEFSREDMLALLKNFKNKAQIQAFAASKLGVRVSAWQSSRTEMEVAVTDALQEAGMDIDWAELDDDSGKRPWSWAILALRDEHETP